MKTTRQKTIIAQTMGLLDGEADKLYAEGWKPLGSPQFIRANPDLGIGSEWHQTFTREESREAAGPETVEYWWPGDDRMLLAIRDRAGGMMLPSFSIFDIYLTMAPPGARLMSDKRILAHLQTMVHNKLLVETGSCFFFLPKEAS